MLERVRDFRYEDIRNWKPLVSLRESYRKESGLRNVILVATILLAILFGFALINGSINVSHGKNQGTGDGTSTATDAVEHASGRSPVSNGTTADRLALERNAAGLGQKQFSGISAPASQIPAVAGFPESQQAQYMQASERNPSRSNASGGLLVAGGHASPNLASARVAIFSPEVLVGAQQQDYRNELIRQANAELQDDQEKALSYSAELTQFEVELLRLMYEQKKELAPLQLQEKMRIFEADIRRQIHPIVVDVATRLGFDVVLPSDSVLAYSDAVDITAQVQQALERQNSATSGTYQQSPYSSSGNLIRAAAFER